MSAVTHSYKIEIEAWPHSTGEGNDADQKAAGPRSRSFTIYASGMAEAYAAAQHIATGIQSHHRVWTAPIVKIERS